MAELMLINPRRRRRKRIETVARRRRRYPARVRRPAVGYTVGSITKYPIRRRKLNPISRRYRRNPDGFNFRNFATNTLVPSAIGAAGALGLDILMGVLPLPEALKTPAIKPIVRLAGAVGIGALAGMVTTRKTGEQIAAGAVTVVLYDIIKGFVQRTMPTIPLGQVDYDSYPSLEYVNPAVDVTGDMSEYMPETDTVGMYVS